MNKIFILCALALLWACGSHNHSVEAVCSSDDGHDHEAETQAVEEHGTEIILSPEQLVMLGVVDETLTLSPLRSALRTSGVVAPSSGDRAVAAATSDGIVRFVNPSLTVGSTVEKGQKLFILSSRSLPEGDRAARAAADYTQAEAAYRRAKELAAEQIVSQKELETAQLEFRRAELAYQAVQGSAEQDGVAITASISGIITSLDAPNGSYAALGVPLATIAQNRRLTLTADVPLTHIGELNTYTDARFAHSVQGTIFSTDELRGQRTGINPSVDPGNAYGSVSFEIDNRAGIIPGAFAEVVLLGAARQDVLSVPKSALLEQEGLYFVVVRLDAECFEVRPVTLGNSDGLRTEILSGIKAGEKVVVEGAYHVKMAGATTAIPDGHAH